MTSIQAQLEKLRQTISQIKPILAAEELYGESATFIDVRESEEQQNGIIPGALKIGRGFLELKIESQIKNKNKKIILYCASGSRSLLAANSIKLLGYTNVLSLEGGLKSWKDLGLPIAVVESLSFSDKERYQRHLQIPEVGEEGQLKLLKSKVLIVGAGGLGSPIALYLAAAGVGTIGVIDDDIIDRSNLQRQIIHKDRDVSKSKVASAKQSIQDLNPNCRVLTFAERLVPENAESILSQFDIIVDGSDNFSSRYLINDTCVKLGLPNVHGAIYRFEGQASVFWPASPNSDSPCYRCLFPAAPPAGEAPSCAEAGVIGALPGVIGLIEAMETLKLILNLGKSLMGRLMLYNGLDNTFKELTFKKDPQCMVCSKN